MKCILSRSKYLLAAIILLFCSVMAQSASPVKTSTRWTEQKAQEWYKSQPWLVGADYIPATAINQIEMWSKDSFDVRQIDKELSWAQNIGFNTMRVFLSSVVWKNDLKGMKSRMDTFLNICNKHDIRPIFVFFDDCWNKESSYGKQPVPKSGIHNSGWVQDPSCSLRADTLKMFSELGKYVKDIVTTFAKDKRILMWDLYNEPGNSGHHATSLPLLRRAFYWARQCNPSQPLTAGIWYFDTPALNAFQLSHSDVISYHCYADEIEHAQWIKFLGMQNRPLVCTEYMARKRNSRFDNIMPLLKRNKVVAINWGFVAGKTNTIFAWDTPLPGVKEPELWFHDIFRQDGTPFSEKEIDFIKSMTE